ncbi:unnamed protein product (macronuclear) [Paramecium tetraurelia]|uniref:Uncharacterized protein n=1 Tax=Paramecium tetraurelia TaxID=5888 RepID=A0CCL5_PARTE|nr:uncharacterized protein GSPATT00037317001 [Paramecium tetraurelia]CAK68532.1 unnamed protein product [Paramecium tetraurelia]|eukprot:XP_001435929.1 hypothetical protein (macronuclear) [Paramecium tetraurelia strain d4-2]
MNQEQNRAEEKTSVLKKNLNCLRYAEQEVEQLKRNYLQVQMGNETFGYLHELKRLFDCGIIVNPEKVVVIDIQQLFSIQY